MDLYSTYYPFPIEFNPAFNPAMIPCAAAYSYPVVPLICPAKYKLGTIVEHRVFFKYLGSI